MQNAPKLARQLGRSPWLILILAVPIGSYLGWLDATRDGTDFPDLTPSYAQRAVKANRTLLVIFTEAQAQKKVAKNQT